MVLDLLLYVLIQDTFQRLKIQFNNLRNNGFDILHYKIPQDVANILSKIGLVEDGDIGWRIILINSITTILM